MIFIPNFSQATKPLSHKSLLPKTLSPHSSSPAILRWEPHRHSCHAQLPPLCPSFLPDLTQATIVLLIPAIVDLLFSVAPSCSVDFGCIAVGSLIGLFSHHQSPCDVPTLPCGAVVTATVEMGLWKP
ncbi:hypothetical protein V6N11_042992 [Hibiscus sabdariffa]|uniref:Uncharacterized protein n=1 Tax=Hibiscus sabdariffa TaxID=183260 RepID=A0ABR2QXY7_9ROSI